MSEKLFIQAYNILEDGSKAEEERIDDVEDLAQSIFQDLPAEDIERLVLDILMAHHRGKDPKEAARSQRIAVSKDPQSLGLKSAAHDEISHPLSGNLSQMPIQSAQLSGARSQVLPPSQVRGTSGTTSTSPSPTETEKTTRTTPLVAVNLKPFDQLRNLLGWNNSDDDIERALAHNDFDLNRTISMLAGEKAPLEMTKEQVASRIMCRYFITGNCVRGSQCMYSHEASTRLCRFWLHQRCLAGPECIFLHEIPQSVIDRVSNMQPSTSRQPGGLTDLPALGSLPSLGTKPSKKSKALQATKAADTADFNKLSPLQPIKDVIGSHRGRVPLVAPRLTPWKATDFATNEEYVNLRKQATTSAEQRNKLLQQSTAAWSSNDSALAKKLSERGREQEQQMIELSRKAADLLWEQRKLPSSEIWLDLHALDLSEAIEMLENKLEEVSEAEKHSPRALYVITGRGHFKPKKYADFLTQYVILMLDSAGYKHRDFGVDLEFGRITAVDPWSKLVPKS